MSTKRVAAAFRRRSSHPGYSTGKSAELFREKRPNRVDASPEGAKATPEANGFDHRLSRFSIFDFLFSLFRSRRSPGQTSEDVHIIEVLP